MSIEKLDLVILGAGIAGLGAAYRAREESRDAVVFEARDRVGGLLDNFIVDGFRFDHAVHLSFATEPKVREIFDKIPFYTHPADSYCFDEDRWFKHPVQNNLFPADVQKKVAYIESFLRRPEKMQDESYEAWLRHQYGDEIAEHFPVRYTRKYWGTEASNLGTQWIGNRMRRAELKEILFGAFTPDTPNTYYTKEMRYPKVGGFKAFIGALIGDSDIRTNHRVIGIDTESKIVTFSNGQAVAYNELISTLPLPVLVSLVKSVPAEINEAASKLKATSIDLVSVGFNKSLIKDLWFYIYDDDILASRAYSPSVKSPENAPDGCSSLQFEIYTLGTDASHSPEELKKNTLHGLLKMGICNAEDIVFMDHRRITYGNVVFLQGMELARDSVRAYLRGAGIATCGRFGEWDYLWSNQSFLSGYNCRSIN